MSLLLHQLRYDQKVFWRNPAAVFFSVMFPVILLLIFATIFGDEIVDVNGGIETTTYYVPAIITLAVISATMQTLTMSLVIAREDGRLKRGRATPRQQNAAAPTASTIRSSGRCDHGIPTP